MLSLRLLPVFALLASALLDVQQLYEIPGARSSPCQASDGSNNWGVFFDNYARQSVLWSQDASGVREWDVSPGTLAASCNVPPLLGFFPTPASVCPVLDTTFSRDLLRSSSPPGACSQCVPSALDACSYLLQVSDARCGSPYNVAFGESRAWTVASNLAPGQTVTGAGRVAIDGVVGVGGSSADACTPLLNGAEMSGHWCVVQRSGACSAATAALNCLGGTPANPNGVVGVIVVDSAVGVAGPPNGASLDPVQFPLSVPLLLLGRADYDRLAGAVSSTLFTLSKRIGPANFVPFPDGTLLTRESRTGVTLGNPPIGPARRLFAEPHRLYGWAWGALVNGSTSNVALLDLSAPATAPPLKVWSLVSLGLPAQLDVSPGSLVFVQQRVSSPAPVFAWVIGTGSSFVFWNVTDALNPRAVGPGIPQTGLAFVNRAGTRLWQQVEGWRVQQAWDVGRIDLPLLLGAFALDTTLLASGDARGRAGAMQYPTFDSWGVGLVSFSLGDSGVAFYNYSNATSPVLAAFRDTSPSSCSPPGVGGPWGAVVPSPEPNVWFACRQFEPQPRFTCGVGRVNAPTLVPCNGTTPAPARVDFVAYRLLSPLPDAVDCDDGAVVNMFFNRQPSVTP